MSFLRKIERNKEKQKQNDIKKTYGKKPKGICPRCGKHSLFMTNKDGEVFCIRCDQIVKIN